MSDETDNKKNKPGSRYSHYVLFLLVIAYIFNFIDRNILSILSQDIQADLGVTDAQIGFLYGTVFAVFLCSFWNTACQVRGRLGSTKSDLSRVAGLERDDRDVGVCEIVSDAGRV